MKKQQKEPASPVSKERAMEHSLLTIRRAWAGLIPEFAGWGKYELDPAPLIIHDLNGQPLFYDFKVMDGNKTAGTVRAGCSKIIGSAVPAIEFGPRSWDPDAAANAVKKKIKEHYPKAEVMGTELVCYSYPKIGVRITVEDKESGRQCMIFDVADMTPIETIGADEPEGSAMWSFYDELAHPHAAERELRWEQADQELEAARSATPRVFERGYKGADLPRIKPSLLPENWKRGIPQSIPFYSSRRIQYALRCPTHDCFVLYGQKTNVFCAVATGQMILDFYRYYFSQDQIATAMGTGSGGTSNPGQVQGYESLSNNCLDAAFDGTAKWMEAKSEIDANRPLKSGIPGHARACAGWKRQNICLIGQKPKHWLLIFDPWPWNADICKGGKIYWEDWDLETHTNFIYVRHRSTPCTQP